MCHYVELDLELMECTVLGVGILIAKDGNQLLDLKHQTRLLGVVSLNLVYLLYKEFTKMYNTKFFEFFNCPEGVDPLLYSQLFEYYYRDVCKLQTSGIQVVP